MTRSGEGGPDPRYEIFGERLQNIIDRALTQLHKFGQVLRAVTISTLIRIVKSAAYLLSKYIFNRRVQSEDEWDQVGQAIDDMEKIVKDAENAKH